MKLDGDWFPTKSFYPQVSSWFLVVVEGHGTRHMKVDQWRSDDMQWKSEYDDDSVRVTHYCLLPPWP